ncbi:hypothetical protein LCGC14_0249640 [marine sediment metagenome]|uniref:Uncharacterized protein n=1 Tax=marine sediment metagenome TaxID=412755 RepID=A0A0F9WQC6_9ZZZZ
MVSVVKKLGPLSKCNAASSWMVRFRLTSLYFKYFGQTQGRTKCTESGYQQAAPVSRLTGPPTNGTARSSGFCSPEPWRLNSRAPAFLFAFVIRTGSVSMTRRERPDCNAGPPPNSASQPSGVLYFSLSQGARQ